MDNVNVFPAQKIGKEFISGEYLPKGEDEYYLRNSQQKKPKDYWRSLRSDEIEALVKNGNTCDDWDNIKVAGRFNPHLIKNSEFFGLVRIGRLENVVLHHHDLQMPAGITNSRIISCDVGDDVAIHDVRYLAYHIIGDRVILLNVDEIHTTDHAKFGNGIVKDGEPENVRVWIDLMNETGSRAVMPFNEMIPADAYIWAKFREDRELQEKLKEITQKQFDSRRGFYGEVGDQSVIKSCRIIKDVKIGPHCYIKGANKLKNLTINSSEEEPTQIGEGVELVNGIIGLGCHVFYGCKAVRFIMGNNSNLKYGARLIHSFLGSNSTVSCCEMLNNLIFPAHEQHHNNSFLIASLTMGQSNVAAGATVGSNHNSRANDGEVQAGRGFWPGLCSTFKHSCRFASFVLSAKGDYPAELNISLPFSLINNDVANDRLEVMPAYWWMYNMYAFARNAWKFRTRDKRMVKLQNIEFESLAPDTVEEIFVSLKLLEAWTAKAYLRSKNRPDDDVNEKELLKTGMDLLMNRQGEVDQIEILGENMECSSRKVVILKAAQGYNAYRQMLHYYAVKNIIEFMESDTKLTLNSINKNLAGKRITGWMNLGGQLVPEDSVKGLVKEIKTGKLGLWEDIHNAYDSLWKAYPMEKRRHAFAALLSLYNIDSLSKDFWNKALSEAVVIQEYIRDQVYITRKKDYDNPFRQATYRNSSEMEAAIGRVEDNSFVVQIREETENFKKSIESIRKRG